MVEYVGHFKDVSQLFVFISWELSLGPYMPHFKIVLSWYLILKTFSHSLNRLFIQMLVSFAVEKDQAAPSKPPYPSVPRLQRPYKHV